MPSASHAHARPPRAIDPVVFALSPRGVMAAVHQPSFDDGATPPLRVHPLPLFAAQGAGVYRVSDAETLVGSRWGINDHARSAHDAAAASGEEERSNDGSVDGGVGGQKSGGGGGGGGGMAAGAGGAAASSRKGSVKGTAAAVAARKAKAREDAGRRGKGGGSSGGRPAASGGGDRSGSGGGGGKKGPGLGLGLGSMTRMIRKRDSALFDSFRAPQSGVCGVGFGMGLGLGMGEIASPQVDGRTPPQACGPSQTAVSTELTCAPLNPPPSSSPPSGTAAQLARAASGVHSGDGGAGGGGGGGGQGGQGVGVDGGVSAVVRKQLSEGDDGWRPHPKWWRDVEVCPVEAMCIAEPPSASKPSTAAAHGAFGALQLRPGLARDPPVPAVAICARLLGCSSVAQLKRRLQRNPLTATDQVAIARRFVGAGVVFAHRSGGGVVGGVDPRPAARIR